MSTLYDVLQASFSKDEWLYIRKESFGNISKRTTFHVTNGFWDKFCLCIEYLFSGFTLAEKTQKAVDNFFKGQHPTNSIHIFETAQKLEKLNNCVEKLSQLKLAGRNKITIPSFTIPQTAPSSLDEQHKKATNLLNILPPQSPIRKDAMGFYKTLETTFNEFEKTKGSSSPLERSHKWVLAVENLKKLKNLLLGRSDNLLNLDETSWGYKFGPWKACFCTELLNAPGGHKKPHDFIKIVYCASELYGTFDYGEKNIQTHLEELESYVKSLKPSQRRPISLWFPSLSFINRRAEFQDTMIEKFANLIRNNPEYFVHQISLYNESNSNSCLSGIANPVKYVPERPLRKDVKQLISRLRLENSNLFICYNLENVNAPQEARILRELQTTTSGKNYVISFKGKHRGCHKEILCAAFPFVSTRIKYDDPSVRINLDKLITVPSTKFEEWILDALITYAYTREHPNLPLSNSFETQEAYNMYLGLIDFLDPGKVSI